jgi:zinc D-Ala-D-Ala carboxypeptidase
LKLSKDFSFEELTKTSRADLQTRNRVEAALCIWSLRKVAQELLQPIREGLDRRITITSGYRGKTLNEAIGGAKASQHCFGQAADFQVEGLEDREGQLKVVKWVLDQGIPFGQLLLERGCIHISLPRAWAMPEVAEYEVKTKSRRPLDLSLVDLSGLVKPNETEAL